KAPAPPRPIPFSAKQEALQHNPGRPLDRETEQALRTRVARQQVNQPGRVAQQEPFSGRPANGQPAVNQPQPRPQMPEAERGYRQPPAGQEVQQQQNAVGRGVAHTPENRPRGSGEQMAPAYRQVPRPPQPGNGQQPGFRSFGSPQGQAHPVAQPPAPENRQQPGFRSFGSPQGESRPVQQPPVQGNRQQPEARPFESRQAQPHSVPQPPANTGSGERNGRSMENPQPRYQGSQSNAAPQSNRGNQGSPVARPSNSQPSSEPVRVERPASPPEAAPTSGREARSQPSSTPPPSHKQESKGESNKDKQH